MGTRVDVWHTRDDGRFPNNEKRPVLLYLQAFPTSSLSGETLAEAMERRFTENGWTGSWRNGVFPYHHYHSNTHEVLGCYAGQAQILLGGDEGFVTNLEAGDVVVIPAGVAHKRMDQSQDFGVVGAYPDGRSPDMNYGNADERPAAVDAIGAVPIPDRDPVSGPAGPLPEQYASADY